MSFVPLGILATMPSSSLVTVIWQPSRDVSVRSKARSSMSSSSSSGGSSESNTSCVRIRWHVEHAREPSHAPSRSISFACATRATSQSLRRPQSPRRPQ